MPPPIGAVRPLSAGSIVRNGNREIILTSRQFLVLTLTTTVLHNAARLVEDSPILYRSLIALEYVIFYSGSLGLIVNILYLLWISVLERYCALRRNLWEVSLRLYKHRVENLRQRTIVALLMPDPDHSASNND
jgi:hypothetical protein